jgi:putative endopeptidase
MTPVKLAVTMLLLLAVNNIPANAADAVSPKHSLDLTGMDKTIEPGDDFYEYANGHWMKDTTIPLDRPAYGTSAVLADDASNRTAYLIRSAAISGAVSDSEVRKIGDYYAAYMDADTIERASLRPLAPELDAIRAIASKADLAHLLGTQLRADVDPLNNTDFHTDRVFGLWVAPDFNAPEHNAAYLLQGGLGMPDRDNYVGKSERDIELQSRYHAHIAAVLMLARIDAAAARATRIYDLERKIAEAHVSRRDSEDVQKANNPWHLHEFSTKAPGLDWSRYFQGAGLDGQQTIMVWQPSAITGIAALVRSQPLEVWKDYLLFHALDRFSPVLPSDFVDEWFKFYGTALTGALRHRPRRMLAVDATDAALGDAVGKLYAKSYFPPEAKAQAQAMVRNIVDAFGRRIDKLEWMSRATRGKAKEKLAALYIGIGYPEQWRDYGGLKVAVDDALGNLERSELFDYHAALVRLGKPVDRSQWALTPQTVNAVNLPLQNALNFPAAILNPPFFDIAADSVQNYGAIGAVIGHEISHCFDDEGSQFDARGRLMNWWTSEDLAHFRAAADHLASQFDTYEPLVGLHVNGHLTLSENLADVAGIAVSYDAYQTARGDKPAPEGTGLSADQRFFVAFAQVWRSKQRPESMEESLMTNCHAPGEYRADTVRNIDAWYRAFDVQPGQKLYLPPEARVRAW